MIHRHVNIFFITSYFTLQQVKVSIEIVFGSQLTRKDDKCHQFFFKLFFSYFRCWSVLTPYDPFYLVNIFWMVTRHALK